MKITPLFKDDTDKIIIVGMIILSIFFFLFPSLIVVLCLKNQISENSYNISKSLLNFEILIFLISLICMIPILGWLLAILLCPILEIINIIVMILALCSIGKNSDVNVPVMYEFI